MWRASSSSEVTVKRRTDLSANRSTPRISTRAWRGLVGPNHPSLTRDAAAEVTDGRGGADETPPEEGARGPPSAPHPDTVRTATMVTETVSSRDRHR
ncbi:hypothetical protein Mro03_54840 [Microbispora rosea subsp. rosea]|nr:hypothetical protein Mro03_54840 [Microbispora rosea subsp. rosea]